MPVIIVGNEKNFAALRSRIFSGRVPSAAAREVTEAIAAANPHADLEKLEPGTVLTIPDVPHVKVSGELSLDDTSKQVLAGIAQASTDALEDILAAARAAEKNAATERRELTAALGAKELDDAAKQDKDLDSDVKAVRKAVDDEEKLAKTRLAALQEASKQWTAELKSLEGLLA